MNKQIISWKIGSPSATAIKLFQRNAEASFFWMQANGWWFQMMTHPKRLSRMILGPLGWGPNFLGHVAQPPTSFITVIFFINCPLGPSESGDAFLAQTHQRADRGGASWPMVGAMDNGETMKIQQTLIDFDFVFISPKDDWCLFISPNNIYIYWSRWLYESNWPSFFELPTSLAAPACSGTLQMLLESLMLHIIGISQECDRIFLKFLDCTREVKRAWESLTGWF